MYTSGTTATQGQLHTTGGYLTGVSLTHQWIFDLKEEDVTGCTDIGWVTGHSYRSTAAQRLLGGDVRGRAGSREGPLLASCRKVRRHDSHTAPTLIRTFMRWGDQYLAQADLSSLRLLGTVGEPINPEAWMWFYKNIGKERCPVVDTWWQTETGMIMISPLPGIVPTKPGSATRPFPGVEADILDESGQSVPVNTGGNLVIKRPWPAMSRTIWGDT
jgi:acetyl-CoA synthetase